jgi:hypothetical protein
MGNLRARDLLSFKLRSKQLSKFEIAALAIVIMYFAIMAWIFFNK